MLRSWAVMGLLYHVWVLGKLKNIDVMWNYEPMIAVVFCWVFVLWGGGGGVIKFVSTEMNGCVRLV